jgi:CubicO group peptidase (beta-lactamase class C family)
MKRIILILLTLTLSMALLVAVIVTIVSSRDDYYIDKFDQLIPQLIEQYKVPGMAVSLARNGEAVWSQGYGLDAPVEKYLTRWRLPASNYDVSGVTIRRLLSHSAGLSVEGYPGLHPDVQLPTLEKSLSGDNRGAGALQIIMEPGAQFSYSVDGYTLLQLNIEEVTG